MTMSRSLYGWILCYLQSDWKCEGCDLTSCARFPVCGKLVTR